MNLYKYPVLDSVVYKKLLPFLDVLGGLQAEELRAGQSYRRIRFGHEGAATKYTLGTVCERRAGTEAEAEAEAEAEREPSSLALCLERSTTPTFLGSLTRAKEQYSGVTIPTRFTSTLEHPLVTSTSAGGTPSAYRQERMSVQPRGAGPESSSVTEFYICLQNDRRDVVQ